MKYLAVLRGINVGGHRKILMTDLKSLFNDLSCTNILTYIQSGNVLFQANEKKEYLEVIITKAILDNFGFEVPVIVIEVDKFKKLLSKNPYAINSDKGMLHVTFLKEKPNKESVIKIKELSFSTDLFEINDNLIFLKIDGKYHKSKLSNNFFEKQLKVIATTRNWKTINKLIELSEK